MNESVTTPGEARTAESSRRLAALPMYDFPHLKSATDAFWRAIAERLEDAGLHPPASLTRASDYQALWHNPRLLFGQTCGYPLVTQLRESVHVVAVPVYGSSGCRKSEHCSFFIVNADAEYRTLSDLRGGVCAVNGFDSNSGMNLLRAAIAPLANAGRFFRSIVVTGAHFRSVEAVARGHADVAAIDCVSFAHFKRLEPELAARVSKIGESLHSPAPPYITSRDSNARTLGVLRDALRDIAADAHLEPVRAALDIEGFEFETEARYERLLLLEKGAAALGYPELH